MCLCLSVCVRLQKGTCDWIPGDSVFVDVPEKHYLESGRALVAVWGGVTSGS